MATALTVASYRGDSDEVKLLLDQNADKNVTDNIFGGTPITWAAKNGHIHVVGLLLHAGADFQIRDVEGRTPLLWATITGHISVVEKLLYKDEDENKSQDKHLVGTLRAKRFRLPEYGGLESEDNDGRTPLSWAAGQGHEAVVRMLLDAPIQVAGGSDDMLQSVNVRIDMDAMDRYGRTPLSWASGNGHCSIVDDLLSKGADVNKTNDAYGWTPLWWAAAMGRTAVVRRLCLAGADVDLRDWDGRTPMSIAASRGHLDVAAFLVAAKMGFNRS